MLIIRAIIVLRAACRLVPFKASSMKIPMLLLGHPLNPWRIVLSNTRRVRPRTICCPLKSPAGNMTEKREWISIEYKMTKSSLHSVFSEEKMFASKIKVVINRIGRKAGCRTCHIVCASPVRDNTSA
jgi:hypothetical protein